MNRKKLIVSGLIFGLAFLLGIILFQSKHWLKQNSSSSENILTNFTETSETKNTGKKKKALPQVIEKTAEEKHAVMEADAATMDAIGLHYDYANLTLPQVVQTYLDELGIDHSCIAFSYKNTKTGEVIAMNETQPMTAGSTYKLPLNMLAVDAVEKGKLSMDTPYDITDLDYEYVGEYQAYRNQFGNDMTIPEMQEYSLIYSENTPAYAMAKALGGFDKVYSMFKRYGQSKGDVKTIDQNGNKTTTDYYIQVLDHLWKHQDKYADILNYLGQSFPGLYYETYLPDIDIRQKPGYVREALNIDAVVYEQTPYLIALYTAGLGGVTPENDEVNGVGYSQLCQLTYVINEWHRVNRN
ncbi:serine hydrolase [Streptococcus orisasini]|uniref:serine hydrolase n=1 Tax=Streptococcus orisasini TaxID=1080071 RepID=UPI000708E6AF|nr:serine hydrolase [Streptococcus orisasini]